MKRFVINLYFESERGWCWYRANTREEAEAFANEWANRYIVRPSQVTVWDAPEDV